ncbi:MAG: bifunctional folylpolyglutamate synthase/dihydrofolate synthase [Acidimicrobiales bacterium]|nr:bifunctional folylpolyglutamate synthase/dihydrofolate synthase [Acidimicrobiales bacterium]
MQFDEALAFLDRHINREAIAGAYEGLSLDKMVALVEIMGDPQRAYPVIHVTGSKGKGSTAHLVTRLLMASGLNVGTYTSPHVSSITERIARNGEPISEDEFAQTIGDVAQFVPLLPERPSYFELLTAAAFQWFADSAVDVAVVEVGLLGRFDATNVVDSAVTVCTTIGRSHTDGRDDWRTHIAYEKAGIFGPNAAGVIGDIDDDLVPYFRDESPEVLRRLGDDVRVTENRLAVGGRMIAVETSRGLYDEVFLSLHGAHMADNAALALASVEEFFGRALTDDVVAEAFGQAALPGRAEVVGHDPLIVLDGAHSPESAQAIARTVRNDFAAAANQYVVLGLLQTPDLDQVLLGFEAPLATMVLACAPDSDRAMPAADVAAAAARLGAVAESVGSVADAVERALQLAEPSDLILVSGSFYTVGEAKSALADEFGHGA